MIRCRRCQDPLPSGARACPGCGEDVGGVAATLLHGIEHFTALRYEAALKEFTRAHQLAPGDPEVRLCHGHGLYHAGHTEAAVRAYEQVLQSEPEKAEVRYNLGQICVNQGKLETARAHFESLAETEVEFEADEFYLGLFFRDRSHFRADCFYYLAITCWNRAQIDAAEHYFERALDLNPSHAAACRHLGNLQFQRKRYEEAEHYYQRFLALGEGAVSEREDIVEVNSNLGVTQFELGKFVEALELFKSVLDRRPGHPGAIYHINLIDEKQGRDSERPSGPDPIIVDSDQASTTFDLAHRDSPQEHGGALESAQRTHQIVGRSVAMQRVLRFARLAAASESTVLLTGENGTGKELIARVIHDNSSRRDRRLVAVNCAAIPEALIESELFGHEKGSFTGATMTTKGFFEVADKTTIFLDEIGELNLNMQVKLLRVIQEREFNRVGSNETQSIDVRIIAATNRNLEELLEKGLFRQDLFFRINVLPIHIPALRERKEDVPLLVDHFIRKYGKPGASMESMIDPQDMHILSEYDWPGNIRELENIIERALVMGTQVSTIVQGIARRRKRESSDIESGTVTENVSTHASQAGNGNPAISGAELPTVGDAQWQPISIRELERRHILQTLEHTGGNRARAARILGINPATLWRKMKGYSVEREPEPAVKA